MAATVGKRAISVALLFVRPSVRLSVRMSVYPSVACIANNSRTQRPSVPKFGRFPTLDATRIPVSKSNGQRSGLEAGGGIPCRPNLAATVLVETDTVLMRIITVNHSWRRNTPCPHKKGATDCFTITFTNMHGFLWFLVYNFANEY